MNYLQPERINSGQWRNFLLLSAARFQIKLDDRKIELMRRYAEELLVANIAFNLTGITDPIEIAEKLMLDSMIPGRFISPGASVLDLGTGAGFPGIPLKIVYPNISVTLLDSKRKKINFLKFIIRKLNLNGIQAIQKRVEDFADEPFKFDIVISRAAMALERLIYMAVPLLKKNGYIMAMKGSEFSIEPDGKNIRDIEHMTQAVTAKNNADVQVMPYRLPISGKERALVVIHLREID
jgi:16S rRNA (guanine527-N7)-methyltransferase